MALTSNQAHHIPSRIEKVRGGDGEVHLSGNNGRLPLSHADTPESLMEKLIMVSFRVDWWAPSKQLITTGDHETAHGVPILSFGLECGEAEPLSMEPRYLWITRRLNTL